MCACLSVRIIFTQHRVTLNDLLAVIGTIFADPEIAIWARLHSHNHRFSFFNSRHGDLNFSVREVGTDWRASSKFKHNLPSHV